MQQKDKAEIFDKIIPNDLGEDLFKFYLLIRFEETTYNLFYMASAFNDKSAQQTVVTFYNELL
jgi:hypothetical protein